MRFWLAKSSEVPVREQIVTQVTLGVLSSDLKPGDRLPSVRDMSRRWRVHANTVSSAYQQLVEEGWLERRRGSGVYVRARRERNSSPEHELDRQIGELFAQARRIGVSAVALRQRLGQWLSAQPPERFVVVEPDVHLREIVVAELREALDFPVTGCGLIDCRLPETLAGAIAVALPSKVAEVKERLPPGCELVEAQVASIPVSLAKWLPNARDALVGVASSWPDFLHSARTMLTAAGFATDALVLRDARQNGWRRGLSQTAAVVCDTVTEAKLPKGCRAIPFRLLSDEAVKELRGYAESARGK
jgi:DNA-binding transcriptional regulator YhcF (GntR family)